MTDYFDHLLGRLREVEWDVRDYDKLRRDVERLGCGPEALACVLRHLDGMVFMGCLVHWQERFK